MDFSLFFWSKRYYLPKWEKWTDRNQQHTRWSTMSTVNGERCQPSSLSLSLSLVSWRIASGSVTTRNRNDPFPTGNTYMSCFKSRSGFFWIYFRPPEYKWSQGFWDVFFGEDPSPISTSPRMRLAFFFKKNAGRKHKTVNKNMWMPCCLIGVLIL